MRYQQRQINMLRGIVHKMLVRHIKMNPLNAHKTVNLMLKRAKQSKVLFPYDI